MKFKATFNGKHGTNNLEPLKFRNKCTIWYKKVSKIKGFNKDHGLLMLTNALIDDAELLFNRNRNNEIKTFNDFIQWFDITFNITTLRRELSNKILNFKLNKEIPRLKIVEEFEALYDLFILSGEFATQTLKDYTEFTEKQLLAILTKQFKNYDKKYFYKEWNDFISKEGTIPHSLYELKQWIIKIDDIIIKKSLVNEIENNNISNINTFKPFENDKITDIGSINAVNQNYNNNNNNNYWNNNYDNNYNNNNPYRGRGGYRNNYRDNYRGNYRGRRSYRGGYRGGYNFSRGRGRGYYNNNNGNNRGNNNNNNRGRRGRGINNNRTHFWPHKSRKNLTPIKYANLQCNQCNKWGHRVFYCKFMHTFFPQVVEAYNQSKINNNNNSINNINKSKRHNKRINNDNNNNNNSDSSDSDNENNSILHNSWDSHEKYAPNNNNNSRQ